jgi:hypothetical protein
MEPPWKSLSVIVVTAFFFDMAAAGAVAVEYRRSQWMGSCDSCCCFGARLIDLSSAACSVLPGEGSV